MKSDNFVSYDEHGVFQVLDKSLLEVVEVDGKAAGGLFDAICARLTVLLDIDCNNNACGNVGCLNTDCVGFINTICSPIL